MAWRITTWWKRCYEGLRGARFVSPLSHIIFAIFHWTWWVWLFVFCCVCGLPCLPLFASRVFPVKILHPIRVSFHFEFPVVDRLCHVLARQCRKKKNIGVGMKNPSRRTDKEFAAFKPMDKSCGRRRTRSGSE